MQANVQFMDMQLQRNKMWLKYGDHYKRQTRATYGVRLHVKVRERGLGLRPRQNVGPVCDTLRRRDGNSACGAIYCITVSAEAFTPHHQNGRKPLTCKTDTTTYITEKNQKQWT